MAFKLSAFEPKTGNFFRILDLSYRWSDVESRLRTLVASRPEAKSLKWEPKTQEPGNRSL
jgi:hypothetical protein